MDECMNRILKPCFAWDQLKPRGASQGVVLNHRKISIGL